MDTAKRNELIDAKIKRIQNNLDYEEVELEFDKQKKGVDTTEREKRIKEYKSDIALAEKMKTKED